MNSLPRLTEVDIRERATDTSFERGYGYYRDGAVLEIAVRGNQLTAEVEGSDYDPYQVSVSLGEHGIGYANCTCPYDWGGDCKHIVAVLLAYIHSPEEMEELPSLEAMLADLDRDQLQALILELANSQPWLVGIIQKQVSSMQAKADEAASESAESSPRERRRPLDPDPFRRQVRHVLHSLDDMRPSEAYWYVGGVASSVLEILEQARTFIEAGDGHSALTILEAVTDEYVNGWTYLDDSDGELGDLFDHLGLLWTEAILTADLTPAEREEWAVQLDAWDAEVSDYGIDEAFIGAYEATQQGWDSPILQSILNGEDVDLHEWYIDPLHAELAEARLNILARQGRTQEYLNLAKAEERTKRYIIMLVQLGRLQEAADYGLEHMGFADEALALAKALHERGETESALDIAGYGLKLDGEYSELARWLRDVASSAGEPEKALNAAVIAMREGPSLVDYQAVQTVAGERWPELREELLAHLRQIESWYSEPQVDIFLHEGLIDDAISALGSYAGYSLLERVADAAISERPDWVIQACRKQAEVIMDGGKSSIYRHAVKWLEKARAAYLAADREAEWQEYLDTLLDQHRRKYKLRPMLEALQ